MERINYKHYIPVSLLLGIFILLSVTSMREKSATFDEPVHLASGYSYLKTGDYRMNVEHPPLMKMLNALPLLLFNPRLPLDTLAWREKRQWLFGDEFIYRNRVDADKLIFFARISTVLLAAVLGVSVFKFAKELYGVGAGFFALFLYIFCPNITANAQLVTTDLAASAFVFLSVYGLWKFLRRPNNKNLVFCGVCLGLALASKFTTVVIFPIYFFILITHLRKNKTVGYAKLIFNLAGIGLLAVFVLAAIYQFTGFENYIAGLNRIISEASEQGHESFLFGKYSNTGWRYYYLVAFILKTPLPLIFLLVLWMVLAVKNKVSDGKSYVLLTAIVLIFLSGSFSKKQLGLRYILPVYPFVFVLVSQTMNWRVRNRIKIPVFVFLGAFYLYSNLKIYPHYLSYFNELAGGPDNGWKYLTDSNIDWGQDLKYLKKYIEENKVSDVILSYYGITDPRYYKIDYQDMVVSMMFNRTGRINSLSPSKEILAVSVNNLQSSYFYDKHLFDWLKKKKPVSKAGYSIFIYDITNSVEDNEYLAQIYHNSGWTEETVRQCRRLLKLDPKNSAALLTLACVEADKNNPREALGYYEKFAVSKNPEFLPIRASLINYGSYQLKASRPVGYEGYYHSLFRLGAMLLERNSYNAAALVYGKITAIYPDSSEAYNNLGIAYERAGRTVEASAAYGMAAELKNKRKGQ